MTLNEEEEEKEGERKKIKTQGLFMEGGDGEDAKGRRILDVNFNRTEGWKFTKQRSKRRIKRKSKNSRYIYERKKRGRDEKRREENARYKLRQQNLENLIKTKAKAEEVEREN